MFTVVTVAVDVYGGSGELQSSVLGARAIEGPVASHDVLDAVLAAHRIPWRQLTAAEALDHFARRSPDTSATWEQLSIF